MERKGHTVGSAEVSGDRETATDSSTASAVITECSTREATRDIIPTSAVGNEIIGAAEGKASATTLSATAQAQAPMDAAYRDHALMKRTLLAQSKKIQQLTAKVESMEAEREAMRHQVDTLRMAVFEASTKAKQTAEQCKRDAVEAAVREIAQDRETFAERRREAIERIGQLEDALDVALKASGGVHQQLLDLGLSCEDLAKSNLHLSIAAHEAPAEDKPALALAGKAIEAIVGVMRSMEGSGVFDLLDPVEEAVLEEGSDTDVSPAPATTETSASNGNPAEGTQPSPPQPPSVKNDTIEQDGGDGGDGGQGDRRIGTNNVMPTPNDDVAEEVHNEEALRTPEISPGVQETDERSDVHNAAQVDSRRVDVGIQERQDEKGGVTDSGNGGVGDPGTEELVDEEEVVILEPRRTEAGSVDTRLGRETAARLVI